MPTFKTAEPISVSLELGVADVRIIASDRVDTVVEVRPSDDTDDSDVKAAQQVRVDHAGGVLQVSGPRLRPFDFARRKTKSVDISIELPIGSNVSADLQMGDLMFAGRLGECRVKTSAGNARLELTGPLHLHTGAGEITVDGVTGSAEISTGTGRIQLGEVGGSVVVKNSNGDIAIDAVTGDARLRTANGAISVDRTGAGVEAKTSNGSIRVGEVARGPVVLETAMGDLDIGIADGTAAWLEVHTTFGHVRNLLDAASGPESSDQTVEVRGHTSYGDITIRRS